MKTFWGFIFGAVLGTILNFYLWGILDAKFSPYSTDMNGWVFIIIPIGFILGGLSGIAITCYLDERFTVGVVCMVISIIIGGLYFALLCADIKSTSLKWALADTAPSLIWCIILFFRGTWLLSKSKIGAHPKVL